MNKEWSELNKEFQKQTDKESSFRQGIETLLELRIQLMDVLMSFRSELEREDFNAMPFKNAEGYHSKTIAYSVWHIFRIEDIVAHTLICGDEQVFFSGGYKERINSPVITTGNELTGGEIAGFSAQLDIDELYNYSAEVMESTGQMLKSLRFEDIKNRISAQRRENLLLLDVVSSDEKAAWLVDYWCGKNIKGLLRMPFSRHWIMHTEASLRIAAKLKKR